MTLEVAQTAPPSDDLRRLVVRLDRDFDGTLEALATAAKEMRFELAGLFVEEPALLGSAALPFTRIVSRSGLSLPFEPGAMRRALRAMADIRRRHLQALAAARGIVCTFESRIVVAQDALASVDGGEVIGWSDVARSEAGPAKQLEPTASSIVLLSRRRCRGIELLFTGSRPALALAVVLSTALREPLVARIIAADAIETARLAAILAERAVAFTTVDPGASLGQGRASPARLVVCDRLSMLPDPIPPTGMD